MNSLKEKIESPKEKCIHVCKSNELCVTFFEILVMFTFQEIFLPNGYNIVVNWTEFDPRNLSS